MCTIRHYPSIRPHDLEICNSRLSYLEWGMYRVRALFVQLINQFFRKWISADFIGLWPTRKWKIELPWHISYYLFPFGGKRKAEFRNAHSFCLFYEENKKQTQSDAFLFSIFWRKRKRNSKLCIPFPFSEGNKKGILNRGFLFHFSEESIKEFRMMNFFFLFSDKQNRKLNSCLHPPGSLYSSQALPACEWGLGMRLPSKSIQISDL